MKGQFSIGVVLGEVLGENGPRRGRRGGFGWEKRRTGLVRGRRLCGEWEGKDGRLIGGINYLAKGESVDVSKGVAGRRAGPAELRGLEVRSQLMTVVTLDARPRSLLCAASDAN